MPYRLQPLSYLLLPTEEHHAPAANPNLHNAPYPSTFCAPHTPACHNILFRNAMKNALSFTLGYCFAFPSGPTGMSFSKNQHSFSH